MPKAVMFDCYNTLLRYESQEDREHIWDMMLEAIQYVTEQKLPITSKELETIYEKACKEEEACSKCERGEHAEVYLRRAWQNVLMELKLPKRMVEEKAEDMLLLHRIYARKEKHLFPNVKEELMALKEQGMKLLLLSNAQISFIDNEFPKEVRELFDVVMISEVMGIKKPSEELFGIAFEKLGMKAEDTVFVGDSAEDDMIPSGKLGCHCIMIGKEKKKDSRLSHVVPFNPYKESGYAGFAKVVASL